jgi:hypothetical protein
LSDFLNIFSARQFTIAAVAAAAGGVTLALAASLFVVLFNS